MQFYLQLSTLSTLSKLKVVLVFYSLVLSPISGTAMTHCVMKTCELLVCLIFFYLTFSSCEVLTAAHINRQHKSLSLPIP